MNAVFALLDVKPSERRRVSLLALYSMVVVGGVVITGGLAGRALFLSQLPRDAIALKFLLPPIALALSVSAYARVMERLQTHRLIVVSSAALSLCALALRAGLETPAGEGLVFLSTLFVGLEVFSALAIIQFWTLAGELFDTRQAKRLFGPIAAGGTFAAVAFSLGLAAAARRVPPENLLFVFAASLALCGILAAWLGPPPAEEADEARRPAAERPRGLDALRNLLSHRLASAVAGVVITGAVASSIADYQLDLALQAHYGDDAAGMVSFLGLLRGGAGVVALAVQLFVASRLLAHLGLRGGLLALPVLMLGGQVAIVLSGGVLLAAALPRAADGALKFDLNNTSVQVLSMPIPTAARARAKVAIEGVLKPAILSLLGGLFLVAGFLPQVTVVHWSLPALAVGALWLWFVRRASEAYVEELRSGLRQRRLGGDAAPISLADETSRQALSDALASEDSALVLQALAVVDDAPDDIEAALLRPLLSHPDVEVRCQAVQQLGPGATDLAGDLLGLLESDPAPRVRGAALIAWASTGPAQVAERVLPHLEDEEPELRAAAVRAALLHLGLEGVLHAATVLKALFDSPDARQRVEGARVLGELGASSFYAPLEALLEDPEIDVRIAAIHAAGQLAAPGLVDPLVGCLDDPRTAGLAQRALGPCLGADPREVERRLEADLGGAQRAGLVATLAGMGAPGHDVLEHLLRREDDRLRGWAARALRGVGRRTAPAAIEAARDNEGETAARLAAQAVVLADVPDSLTRMSLLDRLDDARGRLVDTVGLAHPSLPVDSLRESLRSRDRRVRANALELLENVLDAGERAAAIALAELNVDVLAGPQPEGTVPSVLGGVARYGDRWLRACAVFDLGRQGTDAEAVHAALRSPDALVAETARAATRPQAPETTMAMSTLEKVLFLKSIPLFEALSGEAVAQIAPIAQEVRHPAGETFIRAGDRGDCLFVVVDGGVDVQVPDGVVANQGPRSIIGELAVLSHRPRNADCVAASDLLMLRIDKEDFWRLLEERPELSTRILRQIIDRYV